MFLSSGLWSCYRRSGVIAPAGHLGRLWASPPKGTDLRGKLGPANLVRDPHCLEVFLEQLLGHVFSAGVTRVVFTWDLGELQPLLLPHLL